MAKQIITIVYDCIQCPKWLKCKPSKALTESQRFAIKTGIGLQNYILPDCPLPSSAPLTKEQVEDNIDLQLKIMEPEKRKVFEQARKFVEKAWPFTYMPKKSTLELFMMDWYFSLQEQPKQEPCPNCKETIQPCACMRNKCHICGNPVGNITFTVCDDCWDKDKLKSGINEELRMSIVKHPINDKGKENKLVTYCYHCGTNVRQQKFCHNCGYKLIWQPKPAEPKEQDYPKLKEFPNEPDRFSE